MNHDPEKSLPKMFDFQQLKYVNSPIFSTIIFAAIVIIVIAVSIASNVSLESDMFTTTAVSEVLQVTTNVPYLQPDSEHEEDSEISNRRQSPLAPPKNATSKERMQWLQEHLSEFEVFSSNNISQQLHGRVLKFFDHGCEVNFFMTWISPAEFFGRREFSAMESVFKAHPRGCLMILSASMDSPQGYRILKPLLDHSFKVVAATPDIPSLLENTPAKAWFLEMKTGKRDPGRIPLSQNLSNLMRLAVLYKYGGVYLDTDFIVLRSFEGLRNSIGVQSVDIQSKNWTRLNNAVLVFDKNHPLLLKFIEEFASTFNGNKWGQNGPYLVTRVVQRVEGTPGYNFTVLPRTAFYPVKWAEIGRLFKVPKSADDSRWLEDKLVELQEQSYGLHLWNKKSKNITAEDGSAIARIVLDHCVICQGMQ